MLSFGHMAVIFLVVLVVLGPEKLPQVARIMGKVMGDFRRITTDFRSQIEDEMREVERNTRMKEQAAAAAASAAATQAATTQVTPPSSQAIPQQGVPGTEPNGTRVSPGTPYDAPQESPQQATREADQAATVLSRENPADQPQRTGAEPAAVEVAPPDPKNPDDERYHSF